MVSRKIFTSQKLKILVDGKEFQVQALVSAMGAKFVYEQSDIPVEVAKKIGVDIDVLYREIPVKSRLITEKTVTGIMYNLKFTNPSKELTDLISKDIAETGIPSPWRRALPRLNTGVKNLPSPSLVVLYHGNGTLFLTVRNFTLGGLLCEYLGKDLDNINVGAKVTFDLVTNSGDKIAGLTGVICHITEEDMDEKGGSILCQYGIRFMPMNLLSETKYKFLIREYCKGLGIKT